MTAGYIQHLPYCGNPPSPDALVSSWNIDPLLLLLLAGGAASFALAEHGWRKSENSFPVRREIMFAAGFSVLVLALVSPLCPLSVSLFSARVGQHVILTLIAAPAIIAGWPVAILDRFRPSWRSPLLACLCFAAVLWFWHAPAPYAATFSSDIIYWTMHVTTIGAALFLWATLMDDAPERSIAAACAGVLTTAQMGFLGAIITLAPRALYTPHLLTTAAWGLSPLEDQQLGGAIMWIGGCAVFLAVSLIMLARSMRDHPAAARARMVAS